MTIRHTSRRLYVQPTALPVAKVVEPCVKSMKNCFFSRSCCTWKEVESDIVDMEHCFPWPCFATKEYGNLNNAILLIIYLTFNMTL